MEVIECPYDTVIMSAGKQKRRLLKDHPCPPPLTGVAQGRRGAHLKLSKPQPSETIKYLGSGTTAPNLSSSQFFVRYCANMKFSVNTCTVAILLLSNTPAFAHPQPITDIQLVTREQVERDNAVFEDVTDLWKRKGGGGGGGKGGSGSSGSSGGKGGSSSGGSSSSGYVPSSLGDGGVSNGQSVSGAGVGSSTSLSRGLGSSISSWTSGRGGSSSSIGSRNPLVFLSSFGGFRGGGHHGGSSRHGSSSTKSNKHSSSSPKGSSSSNTGGATKTGSGVTPNYGGGRYYGGGATSPYTSGLRSPLGIAAVPLAFGALAFYPGIWLYGAYAYPYNHVSLILMLNCYSILNFWAALHLP
jgi:hypothetical protein